MQEVSVDKEDVFDRIMHLSVLKWAEPFYRSHKEVLLYLFFGGLSFLISVGTYAFFSEIIKIHVLIANVFAWIFSVSFAYITNRVWVFDQKAFGTELILLEAGKFASGRLFTLGIEEIFLYVFISQMKFNSMGIKVAVTFVVVFLNYIISKLWVFRKDGCIK